MHNSIYFKLSEFINSDTANERGICNIPNFEHVYNINRLCTLVLDPARKLLGKPITVTSGYRCQTLNEIVGGKRNSQHLTGCAADIVCSGRMSELFEILSENPNIDQLLFEDNGKIRWLHVSIALENEKPRNYINRNYKAYI